MALQKESLQLKGIRGATTSQSNEVEAIDSSVTELVEALVERNKLKPEQIVSITFSVTTDLNACFPAAIARRQPGWDNVALLDCQQMSVPGDLKNCIRILAHVFLPINQKPQHPYLGEAISLRPDRSKP
ncbi:chorismate mutase [Prochlorococcus sp. MIT 1307]|uniref:chorismate mutase n=1 Tax=Prochlorococcus sp. MIT 1307 TaxID=3096219 RepID=UPI002A75F847|nr:chorismate mutase [Prochlorococcus sp. MIT 1307]